MASWKKYFSAAPTRAKHDAYLARVNSQKEPGGITSAKYNSHLPEVYSGAPNRVERYIQYQQMDLDAVIARALDIIADFSTQTFEVGQEPFTIKYKGDLSETEITILNNTLQQWCSLNQWQNRLWRTFRNTLIYGDQFYIRDPETWELIWVQPEKVEKIIVNERKGKKIEQYVVRDLDPNLLSMVGTSILTQDQYSFPGGYPRSSNPAAGAGTINYGVSGSPSQRQSRFDKNPSNFAVDATHMVHFSLSEGLDSQWPFGQSNLEQIYKVWKQKDLLEDSVIIYRVVRAPERRVFYIDTGSLSGPRAMQYVERIKNEIWQRRIPNRTGGGQSIVDSSYSPIAPNEDYYLATNSEGKGSRIDTLGGGENLGCLTMDTKVKLLDGRDLSISEIEGELLEGKTLWTYSCDPVTGAIKPGPITWAGTTRKNAEVIKLTFDNGEHVIVTPDHKWPIKGVGFVRTDELVVGQSMIGFYERNEPISEHKKRDYTQVFDHELDDWIYTHRMVAKTLRGTEFENSLVFNEKNKDHAPAVVRSRDVIDAVHEDQTLIVNESLLILLSNYYKSGLNTKQKLLDHINSTNEFRDIIKKLNPKPHKPFNILNTPMLHKILESFGLTWNKFRTINTNIVVSDKMNEYLVEVGKYNSREEFAKNSGINFEVFIKEAKKCGFTDYPMIRDFSVVKNHRIVSIERLEEKMNVGTLTIDGHEGEEMVHNWHTFALSVGVFTKNSINDLLYWDNKMMRGLGVPSSYLPTGPEDGQAVVNDGKIGTAYVQEYIFSKTCQRLQNLMSPVFDREFKLFLKNRGIEISSNLYELQMWPPQSFSQYRQIQIDSEQIGVFSSLMSTDAAKYISKRFALQRYLGWTEEDILKNEKLFKEENAKRVKDKVGASPFDADKVGLSGVGVAPEPAPQMGEEPQPEGEMGPEGGEPETEGMAAEELGNAATNEPTPGPGLGM